jgi:SAM-dependent methyltransferase
VIGEAAPKQVPQQLVWTQIPGEPGAEILGELPRRGVLELGCGSGGACAFLAARDPHAIGVDGAPAQIERARRQWAHTGADFVAAEAAAYLSRPGPLFDIVISVFGAIDWTPHHKLLPLIGARLRQGGLLAFSTLHPARLTHIGHKLRFPSGHSLPVYRQVQHGLEVVDRRGAGGDRALAGDQQDS